MEYLTNFYKNKCINLQEKINYLKEEKLRINLAAMYMSPLGPGEDSPGWSNSDRDRYKQWWHSLTPQQQKEIIKSWGDSELDSYYGHGGEYVTPGDIPREFQNPNLPDIQLPQRSFHPR